MKPFKILSFIALSMFFVSCGSNSNQQKNDFSIITNAVKNKKTKVFSLQKNELLKITINNPKQHNIDSITYTLNGNKINESVDLSNSKLGVQHIEAMVYYNGKTQKSNYNITILNDLAPKIYTFKIINVYPHDITSYTQGLEFFNGQLYESTGQRGESKLRKTDYKTGDVLKNINLPKEYFAEGLTILNNNIYQLTWQRGVGFVYDVDTFDKKSSFKYGKSKEGWGLCNDGKQIYKSDGTNKIWLLNSETLAEQDHIEIYHNKGTVIELNELEWVNGKIYSNRWNKNGVAIINPKNGAVEGVIDFSSLIKKVKQHPKLDVLNGIAFNSETKTLFVTGKHWDKLFEVEIIEQ